jgi:predicted O-methyltransferase YrrM
MKPTDITAEKRYLQLLKRALTRSIGNETFDRIPPNTRTRMKHLRWKLYDLVNRALAPAKLVLVHSGRATGETMLGMERLDNIEHCIVTAISDRVPGDVIETGVWRGGGTIFMKAVLDVYGATDRCVWVADSFEGLPPPNVEKYPDDRGSTFWKQTLDVSVDQVKRNFEMYGLLDDRVKFLKGFFSDTMPTAPIGKLAVLRLDGDMYESTYVCLEHLYPKVSPGGFVIVDDYGCVPECAKATEDYRKRHGITDPIQKIDWTGVYWRKAS